MGVGVVWVGPQLYTTHRFMKMQDAPPPTTAPEPTPDAEPDPVPDTTPTPTTVPAAAPAPEAPAEPPPRPQADVERVTTVLEALRSINV